MAVTFPPNPSIGDTVTDPATGTVWTWDGYKWTFTPGGTAPGGPIEGPIVGVTDGSNAPPGMVGEYVIQTATNVPIAADGTPILSITLPPGDWDLTGRVSVSIQPIAGQAAFFISQLQSGGAAYAGEGQVYGSWNYLTNTSWVAVGISLTWPNVRVSTATNITLNLVALIISGGTVTADWVRLSARRVR